MKKKTLITVMFLIFSLLLCAAKPATESFKIKGKLIELSLINIKVEEVSYVKGTEIEVSYKGEGIIFEQDKHLLSITAPDKRIKVWLKLPDNVRYHTKMQDGNMYYDIDGVTLLANDGQKVFMDGKVIEVYDGDSEVFANEDGTIDINDDDGGSVKITAEGIFTEDVDGETAITNFWGKALTAIVGVAVRTVMNAVGETPQEVAATALNENFWNNEWEDFMFSIKDKKSAISSKRFSRELTKNFAASEIEMVSVDNFNGKVVVKAGNYDDIQVYVKITAETENNLDDVQIIFAEGRHLKMETKGKKLNCRCNVSYEITMPQGIDINEVISSNGRVELQNTTGKTAVVTSNGKVEVENHKGMLNIKTSNGSIDVDNVSSDVSAHTSNGAVKADTVDGWLDVSTANGKISIEDCPKLKDVHTSNGNIYIELADLPEDLNVYTSNAAIKIVFSSIVNCDISARTSNGRIKINEVELKIDKQKKGRLTAEYGGGGKLLDLETSNADINLFQK